MAHETAHVTIVDQQHRRIGTGTHAFTGLQSEATIGGGLPRFNAQLLTEVLKGFLSTAQLARQVGADVDFELPHRLLIEHVVEGENLVHSHHRHFKHLGQGLFVLGCDKPLLLLKNGQTCDDRRCLLIGGVFV